MSAREWPDDALKAMHQAMFEDAYDGTNLPLLGAGADAFATALTSSGYRILAPGELEAERAARRLAELKLARIEAALAHEEPLPGAGDFKAGDMIRIGRMTRPAPRTSVRAVRELMEALDAQGRTVKELAATIGCATASVSRWRNGHSAPSMQDFEAMAQALGYRLELVPIEEREDVGRTN